MRLIAVFASILALSGTSLTPAANPVVVMETSYGRIKIELFQDQAPITAKNFLAYTDDKHFDGLIFHRIVRKRADGQGIALIEGGAFMPGMRERAAKKPIALEARLSNKRGTIAMHRTQDPNSATSRFFINVDDNLQMDPNRNKRQDGFAVFGRVTEGMDVVDKIAKVRTASAAGHEDVPVDDIVIKSVKREAAK